MTKSHLSYLGSLIFTGAILANAIANSDGVQGTNTNTAHVECLSNGGWTQPSYNGSFEERHEAGFVKLGDLFYLIGGRGLDAIGIYDPQTRTWTEGEAPPLEINHFQPVVVNGEIWVAGAMTGRFPREVGLDRILIYNAESDEWRDGPTIPESRRRGSCGVVYHEGGLYMVAGIIDGHRSGWVTWLDRYDVAAGTWTELPDAPTARDHFQSVISNNKIWNTAGRQSGRDGTFGFTIGSVDYFDLATNTWSTLPDSSNIPTQRAGNMAINYGGLVLVIGGESLAQDTAHNEVEALNPWTQEWSEFDDLVRGRHGSGVVSYEGSLYIASGSGDRGGRPELSTLEKYALPTGQDCDLDGTPDAEELALFNDLGVIGASVLNEPRIVATANGLELSDLVPGVRYDIEKSTTLTGWSLVESITATSASQTWSPPSAPLDSEVTEFYRLRY